MTAPPMKPGEGVFLPGETDYVWKRGEGPNAPPSPYITKQNGVPVQRVSDYGDAFDQGLAIALAYETAGDLENGRLHRVAGDRGGWTKWGIAEKYNPDVDIKNLTLEDAVKIYRERYWPEAEKLPSTAPNLQALYFEGYMNMGRGATASLQRAVGADPDGVWGKRSARALEKALDEKGEEKVIRDYLWHRSKHYEKIWQNDPSQKKFRKGWQNRVDDVSYFYEDVMKALA